MTILAVAVVAAAALAATIFVIYALVARAERASDPRYMREVYYAAGRGANEDAQLATKRQCEIFVESGGDAHHCGRIAGSRQSFGGDGGPPSGRWLYGPKPAPGTPGISPFDKSRWFQ